MPQNLDADQWVKTFNVTPQNPLIQAVERVIGKK